MVFYSLLPARFFVGIFVANLRVSNINTKPIHKVMVSELSGQVEQIKPTLRGTQVTLQDVHLYQLNKIRINIASKLVSDISYGDVIKLKAKLFPLQGSVLQGTYDFGFYMYMSGIEASGYALTNLEIISNNQGFWHQNIQTLRRNIYNRLIGVLGTETGNFAAAIFDW